MITALLFSLLCSAAQLETPGLPMPGSTRVVGPLQVTVGPTRIIAREARSALVAAFSDGTFVLTGGNSSFSTNIRSDDGLGQLWSPQTQSMGWLNSEQIDATGELLIVDYNLRPVAGQPGSYQVTRYRSADQGLSLEPLPDGVVSLPTSLYAPNSLHWVNDIVELSDGTLLAVFQSLSDPASTNNPWFTGLIRSQDGGASWTHVSMVVSQATIDDAAGALSADGWPLYWATEPTLLALSDSELLCVVRSTNDEASGMSLNQIGPGTASYHDLSGEVRGDEIAPGLIPGLVADRYYPPGPPNAPLIIVRSSDGGANWSSAVPMDGPRGVFPRLAADKNGLIALTYGGLSGVPRHGNAIAFSVDGGATFTDEINVGPFLTTGYTQIASLGHGHFVVFFDATPPQPWIDDEHWWIGQVDVFVKPLPPKLPFGPTLPLGH